MWRDQIKLHFMVFIWGFTSIIGVLTTIPSVEIVLYRSLISAGVLLLMLYYFQKNFFLDRSTIIRLLLTGSVIGTHWVLFFASARISKVSICLAGIATTSLFTAFIEPWVHKKRPKYPEVLAGLLVIVGLYTIFRFEFDHLKGLLLALGSALLAAIFSALNSLFIKKVDPQIITFYEMSGATIICLLFFPFYTQLISPEGDYLPTSWSGMDWIYIPILALVCTVYPFYASVELLKRLSAFYINLIINLEPVYGIVLAFIFFGEKERMTPGFYLGTLLILLTVVVYSFIKRSVKPTDS